MASKNVTNCKTVRTKTKQNGTHLIEKTIVRINFNTNFTC